METPKNPSWGESPRSCHQGRFLLIELLHLAPQCATKKRHTVEQARGWRRGAVVEGARAGKRPLGTKRHRETSGKYEQAGTLMVPSVKSNSTSSKLGLTLKKGHHLQHGFLEQIVEHTRANPLAVYPHPPTGDSFS